ncbi:hypothetical protein HKK55_15030 [Pseudomonas sp. ADAK18]|uniref:hypothetical protein n=1 Tax=Pseudomonas sp. ADAK18 TaxID=2730848 RepID=UPI0014643DBB|nr:hypothetical protein [Pseudomonas sp. ADAK18]QJI29961.1 hypothetical protein HKK55_15030 [Pseudomonas sp. ADAK18]
MYATKLTLILLGIVLYLIGTVVGFVVGIPALFESGGTQEIIAAFAGFITWVLITFGFIIHIIKKARPSAGGGR